MPKKRARRGRKQKIGAIVLLLMGMGALVLAGGVLARYVLFWDSEGAVAQPDAFYFTSDLLREGAAASYQIDPQIKGIEIKLFNAEDEKRVTASKISYKVEVEGGTADRAEGVIQGGAAGNAGAVVKITPADGAAEVVVTVVSESPYVKTLSGKFVREAGDAFTVEDKSGNRAAVLTITATEPAQKVTITLPESVIPDATDSRVAKEGNNYVFQPVDAGVYSLVLLKNNPDTLLTADSVTVSFS